MKKIIYSISGIILIISLSLPLRFITMAEAAWPDSVSIESDSGIVIDADSGTVLYGKNINEQYYPASITKLLTALVIIENCDLDDEVTFSHNAVHNVESGSSNAGYDEGDKATVRDLLYAMLLKSANEAANALAEHCSGSIGKFCELMNQKAESLGCQQSHFANPSGLNNENHYTTAYDFALISQAAFKDPILLEIDSAYSYKLPPSKNYPEGQEITTHHGMLKKQHESYYEYALAGKTGYTSLAGNTLVTYAKRGNQRLIAVVLNGHQTHYTDTRRLMEFGFKYFKNIDVLKSDLIDLNIYDNLDILGNSGQLAYIAADKRSFITLPRNADISEVSYKISYKLNKAEKEEALAKISYSYGDRQVGYTFIKSVTSEGKDALGNELPEKASAKNEAASKSSNDSNETSPATDESKDSFSNMQELQSWIKSHLSQIIIIAVVISVMVLAYFLTALYFNFRERKEFEELQNMRKKRREALNNRRSRKKENSLNKPHSDKNDNGSFNNNENEESDKN